jgi:large subunit ribosomal protein L4
MIELPVYNTDGQQVASFSVDESSLGGSVRYPLLKQAVVMYHANRRAGTAATRDRSMVAGSSRKLYRQKGTGYARVGNRRTGKRVGGGVTFAKTARDFGQRMPKKQRRLARDSAVLAKLLGRNVVVVEAFDFQEPKTKEFAGVLKNLKIERSCLVATSEYDEKLYRSARNVPKVDVMPVAQLNAADICRHQTMLFTKDALTSFINVDQPQEQ